MSIKLTSTASQQGMTIPVQYTGDAANRSPHPKRFSSWNQVVKAMSDSRYNDDPAYRAEVEARIAVSKAL